MMNTWERIRFIDLFILFRILGFVCQLSNFRRFLKITFKIKRKQEYFENLIFTLQPVVAVPFSLNIQVLVLFD